MFAIAAPKGKKDLKIKFASKKMPKHQFRGFEMLTFLSVYHRTTALEEESGNRSSWIFSVLSGWLDFDQPSAVLWWKREFTERLVSYTLVKLWIWVRVACTNDHWRCLSFFWKCDVIPKDTAKKHEIFSRHCHKVGYLGLSDLLERWIVTSNWGYPALNHLSLVWTTYKLGFFTSVKPIYFRSFVGV